MGKTIVQCSNCGRELEESPSAGSEREPCPDCGSLERTFNASGTLAIGVNISSEWEHTREFYEQHRLWQAVALSSVFLASAVGLIVEGYAGCALGLTIGLAGYLVAPRGVTHVRQVERSRNT